MYRSLVFAALMFGYGAGSVAGASRGVGGVSSEGRWWIQLLEIEPQAYWLRAVVDVSASNTWESTFVGDNGATLPLAGSIGLLSLGIGQFSMAAGSETEPHCFDILTHSGFDIFVGTGAGQAPDLFYVPPRPEVGKYLVGGVRLDPAGYEQADLEGSWTIIGLDSTVAGSIWVRGWVNVDATGSISGEVADATGAAAPLFGTMTLSPDGAVTTSINPTWRGALTADHDLVFATQTRGPGRVEFDFLVRAVGPYSTSQMEGRYGAAMLRGADPPERAEGVVNIGIAGDYRINERRTTASSTDSSGTGALSYGPTGVITDSSDVTWVGVMNPARSIMIANSGHATGQIFAAPRLPAECLVITRWERTADSVFDDAVQLGWIGAVGESYDIGHLDPRSGPGCYTWEFMGLLGSSDVADSRSVFALVGTLLPVPAAVDARVYRVRASLP